MRKARRIRGALIATLTITVAALAVAARSAPAPQPQSPAGARPGATPAAGGIGSSNLPIDVTSDNYDYRQPDRVGVYTGNVEAVQGTTRLRTPKLTVYFAPRDPNAPKPPPGANQDEAGQVERIEAEGPVHYTTPTERALGDHGTYIADGDTITLTGNVVLVQDKNVATGDKLVIEQKTGRKVLTSNPGKTTPQRVRTVLYPNNNQTGTASVQTTGQAAKPAAHP
jgi:lipopolysaccharide export system protein LptA